MASILRSGKFLRYFAGFTRNVVVNTVRETEGNIQQSSPCMCSQFQHGFATAAAPKADLNLENHLKRLDQDVRRIGRISRRDIEDVLEEIRHQRSATSSQSLLVIRCCGKLVPEEIPEVRTALVQEIWKTLNALNIPMDISHYNALLRVYLENEHTFSPTDFLAEIEAKSIEPNRVTYQRLITRYCQQGDIEGATRILEFMRGKNLPVNENVFNSLILGHSQANDMESAKGILTVMKQAGLEPSADTYHMLLCCHARHGDVDAITSVIEECEKKEVFLLDKDLLDAVYLLTINGHADKVDVVLGKLRLAIGFNQDAVNTILQLVNKGHEDVALKILRLMPRSKRADGQMIDAGSFFIKQLVKANRPVDKILSICKMLQDEGLNPKALLIATEAGLINGSLNNALPLLKEMKNAGLPIRQHYFWPLICSATSTQVLDIVRHMQEEFEMSPSSETLRDYVIPNLKEKNWEKIMGALRDAGISNATVAASAASVALNSNQLEEAANIMESYRAFYSPLVFKQPLIKALARTKDYDAFTRVVRQIHDNIDRLVRQPKVDEDVEDLQTSVNSEDEPNESHYNMQAEFIGQIVNDVYSYCREDRSVILETILNALVKEGLTMSNSQATRLSDRIGSQMTPAVSELLGKLTSGDLQPIPLKNTAGRKRSLDSLTVEELERFIENVKTKQENTNNLKKHLLMACFRSKNLPKTKEVIEKLEADKFIINSGIWAQLIDLQVYNAKLDEALELYEKLKTQEENFTLDSFKTIRIVELMLKEDRLDDALNFLERNGKPNLATESEGSFNYITTVWRLLNSIAETGDYQKLQKIFNALLEGNYVLASNVILGPLIKVHLVRDDLLKAVEEFERICEQYKATPWKNELACRLIQKEDAANLQKLTDLSTNIHGEVNSLYDLVFSFIECGRIRQARKILETPGLRTRPHRIDSACERYKNEGMTQPLEGLVEATKDLHHIDRNIIYYSLLLSYKKTENPEKALGLWTKMQEEGVIPSEDFLIKLAELLKNNNIDVPFAIPEQEEMTTHKPNEQTSVKEHATKKVAAKSDNVAEVSQSFNLNYFRRAIKSGEVDAAIDMKYKLHPTEPPSVADLSHLIEQLVRVNRLSEATKYVNELLAANKFPMAKIFKFYLNKLANSADLETMYRLDKQLTDEQKKVISFDNRFCNAHVMADKVEEYMKHLSENITNAQSPEEVEKLVAKFPRGGALGILEKHPEMITQYEEIAKKYAKYGQLGPINVLWMHLITHGEEAASQNIWDTYLSNAPRIMFQRVLQSAREQNDEKLAQHVFGLLCTSKISEGALGNAASCLIDIQIGKEKYDEALETLNSATKDISLENINRTALERLKTGLEKQNKQFPYDLSEVKKNSQSSSSSSSSSDDDVTPKRPETRPSKPTSE